MKNHFFFGYGGNKRNEMYNIINIIDPLLKNNDIINIIEPFCGSCSISYSISLLYPKKFTYILNDNNKFLIELLELSKNEKKLEEFNKKLNDTLKELDKPSYELLKKKNDLLSWYILNKVCTFRVGFWKLNYKYKEVILKDIPIINFLKTEKIILLNNDYSDLFKKYSLNDEKNLFLMDPPYIQSCNQFYKNPTLNIYEFFYRNKINFFKSKILFILENNWIINLLFEGFIKNEYSKIYNSSKKNTSHLLISNF